MPTCPVFIVQVTIIHVDQHKASYTDDYEHACRELKYMPCIVYISHTCWLIFCREKKFISTKTDSYIEMVRVSDSNNWYGS